LKEVGEKVKQASSVIREQFLLHGVSVREWALARGFSVALVYAVLAGKSKASRGKSYEIATALGMLEHPKVEVIPAFVNDVHLHRRQQKLLQERPMT